MVPETLQQQLLSCVVRDCTLSYKVPDEYLSNPHFKALKEALKNFHTQHLITPTKDTVVSYFKDQPLIVTTYLELQPIGDPSQFNVYLKEAYDEYCKAVLHKEMDTAINQLMNGTSGSTAARNLVAAVSAVKDPLSIGQISRGFHYELAEKRWEQYNQIEANPAIKDSTPFGIRFLDEVTNGGLRRGWSVAFRGPTKAGKSKLLLNISYNVSRYARRPVMHVTREMARKWLELCIDSRDTGFEFDALIGGSLTSRKMDYGRALQSQFERRDPFYIVDIPMMCTTADLMNELEIYRGKYGDYPEGLVLDYGGLLAPTQKYTSQHERYNFLSQELHELAHKYNIWVVTAYQTATDGEGTAFSKHIKDHVEVMFELQTDEAMRRENRLKIVVEANRYGVMSQSTELFAPYAINFIGDWDADVTLGGASLTHVPPTTQLLSSH